MSRPKYWWYHYVKESIMRNMSGTAPLTYQNYLVKIAVDKVIEETKSQYRGAERLRMIDLIYRKRQYNVPGAAVQLYISESTACKWNKEFVYAVADKMGYFEEYVSSPVESTTINAKERVYERYPEEFKRDRAVCQKRKEAR